jgi:hypothetical protein
MGDANAAAVKAVAGGAALKRFRILSLDGGGSWALLQVHALEAICAHLGIANPSGHDILRRFDLVVANSGGSIVACALAANFPLREIRKLFLDPKARNGIFVPVSGWEAFRRHLPEFGNAMPRYQTGTKLRGLLAAIASSQAGDPAIGRLTMEAYLTRANANLPANQRPLPHFVFAGFDYDRQRERFFRTNSQSKASSTPGVADNVTFIEACHASTNAPVKYFDEPASVDHHFYWDGAMGGFNNPVMAGVVEARANDVPVDTIHALTLGTGRVQLISPAAGSTPFKDFQLTHPEPGWVRDIELAASCILDDPPDHASFVAYVTLGGKVPPPAQYRVIRMNPLIRPTKKPGTTVWDEVPKDVDLVHLSKLELDATAQADVQQIEAFGLAWTNGSIDNEGIRSRADLSVDIGHESFAAALNGLLQWLKDEPQLAAAANG